LFPKMFVSPHGTIGLYELNVVHASPLI
jgi:hypothetical protein